MGKRSQTFDARGKSHGTGDEMQQSGVGKQRDEGEDEQSMQPPHGHVPGARAGSRQSDRLEATCGKRAHKREPRPGSVFENDPKSLEQVSGHADGCEECEHEPVTRFMPNLGWLFPAAISKETAAGQQGQPRQLENRLVNDKIEPLVKDRVLATTAHG